MSSAEVKAIPSAAVGTKRSSRRRGTRGLKNAGKPSQAKPSQAKPSQAKRPAASLTRRVHRAADSIPFPSLGLAFALAVDSPTQSLSCTRRCGAVACRRIQTNILRTSLRQKQQEEKRDMDANKWRLLEEFQAPRSLRRMHACTRALFFRPFRPSGTGPVPPRLSQALHCAHTRALP